MAAMNQENNRKENEASSHWNNNDCTRDEEENNIHNTSGRGNLSDDHYSRLADILQPVLRIYYVSSPPGEFSTANDVEAV